MRLALIFTIAFITFCSGCGKSNNTETKSPKGKSTLSTVIDGATGKTAVDAGQKAKAQIEAISEKKNNDLNEILGE